MKKSIKTLLVALFVSFAFVLSACGGETSQLDIEPELNLGDTSTYATATQQQTTELSTNLGSQQNTQITKYRMSLVMDMGQYGLVTYNSIIANTADDVQFAAKMTVNSDDGNIVGNVYYDDGIVAINAQNGSATLRQKAEIPVGQSIKNHSMLGSLFQYDLNYIKTSFQGVNFDANGATLKVSTEDTITRYEVTYSNQGIDVKMYFVFEEAELTQCKLTAGQNISIVIAEYDGEIEIPSFDDYTLVDYAIWGMA